MIQIGFDPDFNIEPGHQWLAIENTEAGRSLAFLLTGHRALIQRGNQILVPHDAEVDQRIVQIIDQLAHARYHAPGLIQMTLKETTK